MNHYQILEPKKLILQNTVGTSPAAGFVKVRITKAGITDTDISLYTGDIGATYPIIPGRQGVGVVCEIAEDNIYDIKKGDRVLINPYLPCGECFYCKTGARHMCLNMKIMGVNTDGFLRDFINVPLENIMVLPEQTPEHEAVFTEHISLALEVLDTLNIEKGDHVVIVGGDVLGNILAQLTIYYQAIPILVDASELNLNAAKESGIYYTLMDNSNLQRDINQITGGRLAKYVIYISGAKKSFRNTLDYATMGGTIAVAGFIESAMRVDLNIALKRQLRIFAFNSGYREMSSAMNMLATKTVDLSHLVCSNLRFKDVPEQMSAHAEEFSSDKMFQLIVDCISE